MLIPISEIFEKYSHIRIATSEDGVELNHLRRKCAVHAEGVTMHYERGDNYFDFLKEQGESFIVFVFENNDKTIGGMGTLVFRKMFIEGNVQNVGYLTEIFTHESLPRKTRVQWRQAYAELLEKMHLVAEFQNCQFLYSAILSNNKMSLNSFTQGKGGIIYEPIQTYKAYNLLGKIPGYELLENKNITKDYTINFAVPSDLPKLKVFLQDQNLRKMLGHYFTTNSDDELARRLSTWQDFTLSSFILVKNPKSEIVACVAPHCFSKTRKLVIDQLSLSKKILGSLPPLLGGKAIQEGRDLGILFLTHLEILSSLPKPLKSALFKKLLSFIYKKKINRNYNLVSFISFPQDEYDQTLKKSGYIFEVVNGTIFSVYSEKNIENVLPCKTYEQFACEMALS